MAAAKITPTYVGKIYIPNTRVTGSVSRRYVDYVIEGSKATQNDWFDLSDFVDSGEDNIVEVHAWVKTSDNAYTAETITMDTDDDKLILGDLGTGTVYARVRVYTS